MFNGRIRVAMLALTDFFIFYAILLFCAWIYTYLGGSYHMKIYFSLWPAGFVFIICNAFIRLYQGNIFYPGASLSVVEELRRLFFAVSLLYLLLFAYLFVTRHVEAYSRAVFALSYLFTVLSSPISRWLARSWMKHSGIGQIKVLIAGAGNTGELIVQELQKDRQIGLQPVGFFDDNEHKHNKLVAGIPVLGKLSEMERIARTMNIRYVIVCLPVAQLRDHVKTLSKYFKHILVFPANEVLPSAWLYACELNGYMGLEIRNQLLLAGPRILKHCLEMLMAVVAVLLLWPLFIILAIAVKLTSHGPVFYRAERLGINGKTINVLKFRTMYADADARLAKLLADNPELAEEWKQKFKLSNDPRITPIGKFLRKTSLDELPQLWNVLNGEMAVIGPRPIVEKEKVYYGENYELFSRVKPGITGLWQVSGRSTTTYERRVFLDVYYIMNWSPWLDYFIFLKTIKEVLFCRGAE